MKKQYHILNGDALRQQLPETLKGEIIVARECLVDGNINGDNAEEVYQTRAVFLNQYYGLEIQEYEQKSASEFRKIQDIESDSAINLWFEEDLFCQVNLWFVLHLITENYKGQDVFLVRPKESCKYSFGLMSEEELEIAFQNKDKLEILEIKELVKLWHFYQQNKHDKMLETAETFEHRFPFLIPAVIAHKARFPENGKPGRPEATLLQIIDELRTNEFAPVFKEFCKREAIYGFGDLQVKRLLDEINNTLRK